MNHSTRHDWQTVIDKYYPAGSRLRDIYIGHCRAVADKALGLMRRRGLALDPALVEEAAMLHDIGIFMTAAPSIECRGTEPYIRHGILGAELLLREGFSEETARVARTHTGVGLTPEEIRSQQLPLPADGDYMPATQLERLVCYADKFFSKGCHDHSEKPFGKARASVARHGAESAARFDALAGEFEPDAASNVIV